MAANYPLDYNRLANLRQQAFVLQNWSGRDGQRKDVEFFQVCPALYEVKDGKIEKAGHVLDADPKWLLALDMESDTWCPLYGFKNATTNFNALTLRLGLKVFSEEDALNVWGFFVDVAKGPKYADVIAMDAVGLRRIVASQIRLALPPDQALSAFTTWLARSPAAQSQVNPPRAVNAGDLPGQIANTPAPWMLSPQSSVSRPEIARTGGRLDGLEFIVMDEAGRIVTRPGMQ